MGQHSSRLTVIGVPHNGCQMRQHCTYKTHLATLDIISHKKNTESDRRVKQYRQHHRRWHIAV